MIAIQEQLPLLRLGTKEVVHYEEDWVHQIFRDAAERSGMDAWFVEDVARGVVLYLKRRFAGTAIDIHELFEKIERTLRAVGFDHVAGNVQQTTPPARLSLNRIAEHAGEGYELVFFRILREQLDTLRSRGTNRLHCSELRDAVMRLCQAKRWCAKCERLQQEIVDFVAEEIAQKASAEVMLRVS